MKTADGRSGAAITPLVSVLILTWNRRDEAERSIKSALAQTYPRVEVVVVDNGSCDGTVEHVSRCFPSVRVVALPENIGCPSGRNVGFQHCEGEYIYQLDDDGWLAPDAVERAVARAEVDPRIAVVMSRIHEWEGDRLVRRRPLGTDRAVFLSQFSGGCSMIRRGVLTEVGTYPEDFFRQAEEADLALRLLEHGYLCVLEPTSIMYHRPSPHGRSSSQALYFSIRNTNKTGLRLWPAPWCFLRPLVNAWHAMRGAMQLGYWALPWHVARELVKDIMGLPGTRTPVSVRAFAQFRALQKMPSAEVTTNNGEVHALGPLPSEPRGA